MVGSGARIEPVDLAHADDFELGAVRIEPSLCLVHPPQGDPIKLEPRAMQVLVALNREKGRPLSHDDLIEACWGGQIVGDNAISRVISQLRKVAASFGDGGFEIETLPRVGYRLVGQASTEARLSVDRPTRWKGPALLLILAIGLFGLAAWKPWQDRAEQSHRIALAILPFEAATAENTAFAAGLVAELRTELNESGAFQIPGAFSVAELSEGGASLNEISTALDISYLVEGQVHESDDDLLVNVSLVTAEDGTTIWSRSYSAGLDEGFDFRRAIAAGLVDHFSLDFAPRSSTERRNYDHRRFLIAMGLIRNRTREDVRRAQAILENLTTDSPDIAEGWGALAIASALNAFYDFEGANRQRLLSQAMIAARRAVEMNDDLALAHGALGFVLINHPGLEEEGGAALQRAVALDPENAMLWFWLSNYYAQQNRGRDVLEAGMRTYQLEPYWQNGLRAIDALVLFGRHGEAMDLREASYLKHPDQAVRDRIRASMAMEKGELSKALQLLDSAIDKFRSEDPRFHRMEREYLRSILGLDMAIDELGLFSDELVRIAQAGDDGVIIVQLLQQYDGALHVLTTNHQAMANVIRSGNCPAFLDLVERKTGNRVPFPDGLPAGDQHYFTILWGHVCAPTDLSARQLASGVTYLEDRYAEGHLTAVQIAHFAMFKAATGQHDEAMSLLQEASEMGWPYYLPHTILHAPFGHALMDIPFFEPLHDRADFRAIVADYDATIARERAKALVYLASKPAD